MPIEIRELVIKATVAQSDGNGQGGSNNGNNADAKEADVNLIVEKVLAILKEKAER
ncbi:MAG: DUF5908 family protein [Haliscomenobacter sp.]|uniref:DUF5908 family protein n=1 Tax=Haliscomenobacter sp. TaxID=2717303 RepID=UPI0029A9B902|nr:DUF5908 family protein [Haliscomenobacter sp.]MDX2070786.1 DUF5908 family protein [Haliscomenobacter sp.]